MKEREFLAFYNEYRDMVRGVLFRTCQDADLDDMTQETFIKLWRHREGFQGQSAIKTWIYRIAANTALDFCRSTKRNLSSKLDDGVPYDSGNQNDLKLLLAQAMGQLESHHRSALVLHVIEGLSIEEIAEVLGIPDGTVKSRLFIARKNLHNILTKMGVQI